MPTYEYRCNACGNAWEELQKISEPAVEVCPKCQAKAAQRLISGGNFILKGGGWYADLYSSSGSASKSSDSASSSSSSSTPSSTSSSSDSASSSSSSSGASAPSTSTGSTTPSK